MKYIIDIPDDIDLVEFYKSKKDRIENRDLIPVSALELYEEPSEESKNDSTGWELYNAYQKAKEKYEKWKKQKNKIKIGDEVYVYNVSSEEYGIITLITESYAQVLMRNGCFYNVPLTNCTKTGKHFPEIAEIINKLKEVYKNEKIYN